MCKRILCLALAVAYAGVAGGSPLAPNHSSLNENLCLWLRMPEINYDPGAGVWTDLSGKGNDAQATIADFVGPTLSSGENPTVFAHSFGAVHFDPTVQELLKATNLNGGAGLTELTIFSVEKVVDPGGVVDQRAVGFGSYNDGGRADHFNMSFDVTVRKDNGRIDGKTQDHPLDAFVIYAARMDPSTINMWFNSTGSLSLAYTASGSSYTTSNDQFYVGDLRYPAEGDFDVAEVVVFNTALTDEQIQRVSEWLQAYVGVKAKIAASGSNPADGATDVSRDAILSWIPVATAVQRDVYFGTAFQDVNNADSGDPMNVLVSQGQNATAYDPGRLEFGQTYYWRIDEVNGAPDNTVFKGNVWSFTVEQLAYPIVNVVATSDAISDEGAGPENTVNSSGLDSEDQHSVESSDMWLAAPAGEEPVSITFEFDRVHKLHEMLIWNYNVQFELLLGFGIKTATVEYSVDGTDWTTVGEVEIAQATASPTYAANTRVDFGGAAARYVRLTVVSGYGMMGKFGLSEVRFLSIPVHAREPDPAVGTTDMSVDTSLGWRAGREAAVHDVYLGTDPNGLALIDSLADSALDPGPLDLATTYYWRVDEVNEADTVPVWEGTVWNFATQDYLVVDDFESYNDDVEAHTTIFDTWIDGWVNDNGSTVGYFDAPFAEQTIVRGGNQSMPLQYDNSSFSFAEAQLSLSQDWSGNGIKSLSLYFYGAIDNTGQLYVKINGTKILYDGPSVNIKRPSWQLWSVDLSHAGNVSNVNTLIIGVEGAGATGILYFDDIRLYPEVLDTSSPDVTGAGDTVQGVPNDEDWPAAEYPALAIDDNVNTKFLHFKGVTLPTGIQVTPLVGATVVTGLTLTTANDAPERDPVAFEVYGSNGTIDGPYTLIASGSVPDFVGATAWPRYTKNATPIEFENTVAYTHYQVLFTAVRTPASANSMQIAEIELIGTAQ